jgi:hypothetical protein
MEVYSYDEITKEYIGKSIAFESPLEPGVYHYPARTTTIIPPENSDPINEMVVWNENNKNWEIVERPPREKTFEELRQEDIDNFIPPTAMDLLRIQRDKRLKRTDWLVMRALTTTGTIPEGLKTYMQELRDLPSVSEPRMIQEDVMFYVLDPESVQWPVFPDNL